MSVAINQSDWMNGFCNSMIKASTQKEKTNTIAKIFTQTLKMREIKEAIAKQLNVDAKLFENLSTDVINKSAIKTLKDLYGMDLNPNSWNHKLAYRYLLQGMNQICECRIITEQFHKEINDLGPKSPGLISQYLNQGINVNSQLIFRNLFEKQGEYTANVLKVLLEFNLIPDCNAICYAIVNDSPYTLEIMQMLADYHIPMNSDMASYAMKYSVCNQYDIIKVLMDHGVKLNQNNIEFACKHLDKLTAELVCDTYKKTKKGSIADELLFMDSCIGEDHGKSISSLLKNQNEDTLSNLLHKVSQGEHLTKDHLHYLVEHQSPYTIELVRFLLMMMNRVIIDEDIIIAAIQKRTNTSRDLLNMFSSLDMKELKISDRVWVNLCRNIKKNSDKLLECVLNTGHRPTENIMDTVLHTKSPWAADMILMLRSYGFSSKGEHFDVVEESFPIKLRENINRALTEDVEEKTASTSGFEKINQRNRLTREVINEFIDTAPGLIELLIRSNVTPTIELLKKYFENKNHFFETVLEEIEVNCSRNREKGLFSIAIASASSKTVNRMLEMGFLPDQDAAISSVFYLPVETANKVLKAYRSQRRYEKKKVKKAADKAHCSQICVNQFEMAFSKVTNATKDTIKTYLQTGSKPPEKLLKKLTDHENRGPFTGDILMLLQENGYPVVRI